MNNRLNRKNHWIMGLLLLLISCNAFSADNFSHKLSEVLDKIKNIKQQLQVHLHQQVGLQKELQQTETHINSVSLAISKTCEVLHHHEHTLSALTLNQRKIEVKIKTQQRALLAQIRTQYLLGLDKNQPQIWLQTKGFDKIDRLLTYNHYLSHRTQTISLELQKNLNALQNNKAQILQLATQTKKLHLKQSLQQKELCEHKQKQQTVLVNISSQVKTKSQQLAQLLKNKENLEKTIQNLQKKETTYKSQFLTHHKGKFPWPTQGKVLERFGSNIAHSELKQNGLLISAPEGQKVYSVAPGKVIFAHAMPGYGLLLIIDHGKGYMTVYGNNGLLYKKVNDIVGSHDLIAKVGHTGGAQKSGVYFALRYQGKPVDPYTWCG